MQTERVSAGASVPVDPGGRPATVVLDPRDAEDVLAINALLGQGVKVTRLTDGSVLVPRARGDARRRPRAG